MPKATPVLPAEQLRPLAIEVLGRCEAERDRNVAAETADLRAALASGDALELCDAIDAGRRALGDFCLNQVCTHDPDESGYCSARCARDHGEGWDTV